MNTKEKKECEDFSGISGMLCATKESRFQHRLHVVMAVKNGCSTRDAADFFGDSQRTVQTWLLRLKMKGIDGLRDAQRKGRPTRLNNEQMTAVMHIIHSSPKDLGLPADAWTGRVLSSHISKKYGVVLGVRQCERYLNILLRK